MISVFFVCFPGAAGEKNCHTLPQNVINVPTQYRFLHLAALFLLPQDGTESVPVFEVLSESSHKKTLATKKNATKNVMIS